MNIAASAPAASAPPPADEEGVVNPHYLAHMVDSAAQHELEASEDIISGNGVKLLAKGARIGAELRERLLQHKLAKPLEDSLAMRDGVTTLQLAQLSETLRDQHELLRRLCDDRGDETLSEALQRLRLTAPLQALLTMYADQQPDRLAHAVGVALLAMALARRLLPGQHLRHRQLALAGLLHDVGELYIEPALLQRGPTLEPVQWRHIASHPVIGQQVLLRMEGVGPLVAQAVLMHHERLDGFGYPRGLADAAFGLEAQSLAAAEWLMGLLESGPGALARASVAARLVPGEFSPALLDLVHAAARGSGEMAQWQQSLPPLQDMLAQVQQIAALLGGVQRQQAWIEAQAARAGPELRLLLQRGLQRLQRLQAAFSSTGLDTAAPAQMLAGLAAQPDAQLHQEVRALVGEFGWRVREMERESLLRASLLGPADLALMSEVLARLREPLQAQPPG